MIKNRKGFTLVELIVVMAIMGMVISTIFGLLFFGYDVYTMTSNDFQIQSDVRLAMEKTNSLVRYSRALFAVPDASFRDDEWSYIGMNPEHTMIINYEWDPVIEDHVQEVLIGPYDGITFNIGFEKENNLSKDNSLRMFFESFSADGSTKRYEIKSGYEALNSLQVVNYGTDSNPAHALAYRQEEYSYENFKLVVNIALVLDVSGSMDDELDPNESNDTRIEVLREQSEMIVNRFSQNSNDDVSINISLVPFSDYAKTPSTFYDVKNSTSRSNLIGKIDNLNADGWTNTGDGLRRAYHQLLTKQTSDIAAATEDTIVKNYTIILVDGESNTSSMYNTKTTVTVCTKYDKWGNCTRSTNQTTWDQFYYEDSGTIKNCSFTSSSTTCTPGYVSNNKTRANEYVDLMGENLSDPAFVTNYIVSFASDVSDSEITFIANATNTPTTEGLRVFYATNADQLGLSFTEIQMSITNDLWHFLGPKLTEITN